MKDVLDAIAAAQHCAQEVIEDRRAHPCHVNRAALDNIERLSDAIVEAQALIDIEREYRGITQWPDGCPVLEAQADLLAVMAVLRYGRDDWHRFNFDIAPQVRV